MAYLALYREWRPKNFSEMVGQEHVTKTLTNALKQEKIAHAYLFSGPRGTGKTTAAKVLAKALNCENPGGVEPCNQCSSCLSIDQGNAMEVLEIDAASNRGIDEIRELRENVRLSAGEGKYKVYIIDEVHMLTTEAFNALLKTLEEPPKRVVFILATTEVQKIPLTILSRVQRFEFHRIPLEQIETRLQEVCQSIDRTVLPEALKIIAQKSEGGLRDALSILDQCLLLDGDIGVEHVYQVLGMVGEEYSAQLLDILLTRDYAQALGLLTEGINQGRDPRQILKEFMEYLRQVLLYVSTHRVPFVAPQLKEKIVEQSEQAGMRLVLQWISILLHGESQLKYASNARLATEMLLVQMIYDTQEGTPSGSEELGRRLTLLEQEVRKLASGQPLQVTQVNPQQQGQISTKSPRNPSEEKRKVEPKVIAKAQSVERGQSGVSLELIQNKWPEVLDHVRKYKKSTHAFLMEGKPLDLKELKLFIIFKEGLSFHRDKVDQTENRETIEKVLQEFFGVPLHLQNMMESEWEKFKPEIDQEEEESNLVVKKAEDIFGADLVIVKQD
ncbi:DNA polymerase III subunit gamma/tau [Desulfitobacterium metallireducens]|uniref:DNA-directed DNA polymerase n=1 Tax=Desulfitobacterium metallireducens DSM 15288 TaxID=871968 RepID=W0E4C8_9FIRM|nr:DNA polymerase III subunit gamma/tau [Desulfitobacterium metallireducens]AHF05680.1 DNA polymerase III subunit gamma/tau [Desulfitobacterium metallireducens DSM 15288]